MTLLQGLAAGAGSRPLLAALLCLAAAGCAVDADWPAFKRGFVEEDGRVVDTGQDRVSHSEGQGFAMILAVHHGDRPAFDRLWQWTRTRLQVRGDSLFAWRWDPRTGATLNNASDGDLLLAWALVRAGEKWNAPGYTAAGRRIAADIRAKLLRRTAHGLVLLPALEGFDKPEGLTVNLSYWVFPALADLGRADPSPDWAELEKTGLEMLRYSHFGRWRLPPDWLKLGELVRPADGPAPRFGYDAVRIPLYLVWGRRESESLLRPYKDFWGDFAGGRHLPAWANLADDSVDSHGADAGIRAIATMVGDWPRASAGRLPELAEGQSYYSAVLLLLAKAALRERGEE